MIQIIILDTDDNLLIFSRSDDKKYKRVREYMKEIKRHVDNNNMKYCSIPFKELTNIIRDIQEK